MDWICAFIFIVGMAIGYSIKVVIDIRTSSKIYKVNQKNNIVKGDQAGRDINK